MPEGAQLDGSSACVLRDHYCNEIAGEAAITKRVMAAVPAGSDVFAPDAKARKTLELVKILRTLKSGFRWNTRKASSMPLLLHCNT